MEGSSKTGLVLPSFRKPPVVEVAMSIGFMPIAGLQFGAMADLRSRWLDAYPLAEEQPFLESAAVPQSSIKIEFGPPPRRLWLVSSAKDRVIQLQRDRFIVNWRAVAGSGQPYPRFGVLREEFFGRWFDFEKFLAEQRIAESVDPQFAEVTYINFIVGKDGPLEIADVLKMNREGELGQEGVITTALTQSWELPGMRAMLNTVANVDSSVDGSPIVLQITANTEIDDDRQATAAIDEAHELVVGTFGVITTEEMQRQWDRVHD